MHSGVECLNKSTSYAASQLRSYKATPWDMTASGLATALPCRMDEQSGKKNRHHAHLGSRSGELICILAFLTLHPIMKDEEKQVRSHAISACQD